MALNAQAITAAIAALPITGVTVKDIDKIPMQVFNRDCPIMFPVPGNWLGAGQGLPDSETTFGTPTTRYWIAHRTYTYVALFSTVGVDRGVSKQYDNATPYMDMISTILVQLDVATVDVESVTHTPLGIVSDPAGNKFIGANFTIHMLERINE